jgi:hypothetical protein
MADFKVWAAAGLAAMASACASGGSKAERVDVAPRKSTEERMSEVRRGMGEAAISPLKDVGLVREEVPSLLAELYYPYETEDLSGACAQVAYQLGGLDAVLGSEDYRPGDRRPLSDRALDQVSNLAVGAARSVTTDLIPMRGWIRRLSGADKSAKEAARAFELGQTRRAFLRGYGAALGCPGLLPKPPQQQADSGRAGR